MCRLGIVWVSVKITVEKTLQEISSNFINVDLHVAHVSVLAQTDNSKQTLFIETEIVYKKINTVYRKSKLLIENKNSIENKTAYGKQTVYKKIETAYTKLTVYRT